MRKTKSLKTILCSHCKNPIEWVYNKNSENNGFYWHVRTNPKAYVFCLNAENKFYRRDPQNKILKANL